MSLLLDDVTLTYPDGDQRVVALAGVRLDVAAGEVVAVTGPSGSGKSSLLAVAGLLRPPDGGTVRLGGVDVTSLRARDRTGVRRDAIGFVFQQANLLASLTAAEQLVAVANLAGRRGAAVRRQAHDLLEEVGLGAHAGRRPHQLSGGQRQRVAIARALMGSPTVLLVDEPTSALDAERGRSVVRLLAEVTRAREAATVLVTHDVTQLDLVDRVVQMRDGSMVTSAARAR